MQQKNIEQDNLTSYIIGRYDRCSPYDFAQHYDRDTLLQNLTQKRDGCVSWQNIASWQKIPFLLGGHTSVQRYTFHDWNNIVVSWNRLENSVIVSYNDQTNVAELLIKDPAIYSQDEIGLLHRNDRAYASVITSKFIMGSWINAKTTINDQANVQLRMAQIMVLLVSHQELDRKLASIIYR